MRSDGATVAIATILGVLLVRLLLGISGYLLAPAIGGSAENQIAGRAAFALRFNFVARPKKAWPRATPIVGALSRPREIGRLDEVLERPCRIVRHIGCKMELAARPQDAGNGSKALVLNKTPFPMPPLRPRVRVDQIDARQ